MLNSIVRFSIQKKLFVALTTLFLFLGGLYAMFTLPIDAVPDITNNQVQIVTVSPTLAPQEVEQLITMPVHISDIGKVNFGSAKRFGAMTMDGDGECVGGIAMMLYKESETGIVELLHSITTANDIRKSYVDALHDYNVMLLELELFTEN